MRKSVFHGAGGKISTVSGTDKAFSGLCSSKPWWGCGPAWRGASEACRALGGVQVLTQLEAGGLASSSKHNLGRRLNGRMVPLCYKLISSVDFITWRDAGRGRNYWLYDKGSSWFS